tara:strand:- start:789 stop:1115 length:327 start_codon:yes stop_codon:yes gene_type:complete
MTFELPKNYEYRYKETQKDFTGGVYCEEEEIVVLQRKMKGQYWQPNKGVFYKTVYVILKPYGFHTSVTEAYQGIELLRGLYSNRTHKLSTAETKAVETAINTLQTTGA